MRWVAVPGSSQEPARHAAPSWSCHTRPSRRSHRHAGPTVMPTQVGTHVFAATGKVVRQFDQLTHDPAKQRSGSVPLRP